MIDKEMTQETQLMGSPQATGAIGRAKRGIIAMTGLLGIAVFSVSPNQATAQDDVALPALTGPHPTGRTSFHWKDASREELETKASGDKRELMVHLFFPANPKATGGRAAYVPDADAMRPPWNNAQIARITALRSFSRENAPLPSGSERYPTVIFMPGGGMKALTYHTLLEDLASHGWVVAAVDPPYNARAVRFPDGRVQPTHG